MMRKYLLWLGGAIIITVAFGTIYVISQQMLRLNANDPQIAQAQDIVSQLNSGVDPNGLTDVVHLQSSLTPALIISDKKGKVVSSSAKIDNKNPQVPLGMLKASDNVEYNAVTWEPKENLRLASVTVSAKQYYVTGVRSLKEVESRISKVFQLAVAGWGISMMVYSVTFILAHPEPKNRKKAGKDEPVA